VHRREEVVESEIIAARGAQHDRQSFALASPSASFMA
jgi:hypothetical protein